jgi:hypothetical protein
LETAVDAALDDLIGLPRTQGGEKNDSEESAREPLHSISDDLLEELTADGYRF